VRVGTASWASVSAGADNYCGIQTDHTLWCWGSNRLGELGDGKRIDHVSPFQVGAAHWSMVSAGWKRACGLHTTGTMWCWGDNTNGGLGTGTTAPVRSRPGQVGTGRDWLTISSGGAQCGLRAGESDLTTVWCWGGDNYYGQIGDGSTDPVPDPKQVGAPDHWTSVSAGSGTTHALRVPPQS